jgi:hypothetical protein
MKRLTVVLLAVVLLLAAGGSAFAKGWDSWFQKKDMAVSGTVGLAWPFGVALYPGFEYEFATWKAGGSVPFSFGVAARLMFDFTQFHGFQMGLGPAATIHLGLKGLDIPDFFQRFDFYWGLGIAFVFPVWWGGWPIGFLTIGGFNYFINPHWAIVLEGNYFGYYGGFSIGVMYKF